MQDESGTVDKLEIAREWLHKHPFVGDELSLLLIYYGHVVVSSKKELANGVFSVWGMSGVGKSFLVKHFYYEKLTELGTDWVQYSWVNVCLPFDLMELAWSLLLDLNPGSLQDRMSTMKDPIQKCHEYLRTHPCLVVIDGQQSTKEWDLINAALGLETNRRNSVVVITSEESVAKYCAKASDRVWNVKRSRS